MRLFFGWFGRIIASVLTIVLVITLLPYFNVLTDYLLPDISGNHIKNTAILTNELQQTGRLETAKVETTGVANFDRNAAFIGTVSTVNLEYAYTGSYGIDLNDVKVSVHGNQVTFTLPEMIVLNDEILIISEYESGTMDRNVKFSAIEKQQFLEAEKAEIRELYLHGEESQALRQAAEAVFEQNIAAWMSKVNGRLEYTYEWAIPDAATENQTE